MAKPYATYFNNPFQALRMARPACKAQALFSLRAVREAALGAAFTPLLAALETAIAGFDENLTDSRQPHNALHITNQLRISLEEDVERVGPDLCALLAGADSGLLGQQIGWVVLVACAVA